MLRRKLLTSLVAACLATGVAAESFPVEVEVDARGTQAAVTPIWRFFGADEPNYATMKDGLPLLREIGLLRRDDVYFRAHNLLTSGEGTPALKWGSTNAYTEAGGEPHYDWRIVDAIVDAYRANGVRPYIELGFMPEALSTAPAGTPYRHNWRPGSGSLDGGWAWPPRDYQRWSVKLTASHTSGMGVLGPTRMDYPGTIASVATVAKYIGEVLAGR